MSSFITGGGSSSATQTSINQVAHGFTVGQWVYHDGTEYVLTDSDASASTDSVGVVASVTDADNFVITTEGYIPGLTGLTAGSSYYLSGAAGAITATQPTVNTKHVLIADSTTSGYVQQYAGSSVANVTFTDSVILTEQVFSTNTFADVTGGVYAIPSAGTWLLRYDLATDGTGLNDNSSFAISDASNNIINGSERGRGGGVTVATAISAEVKVITTQAENYKLRARRGGAAAGSVTILNGATNDSTITLQQIGASPVPMDLVGENGTLSVPSGTVNTASTSTYADVTGSSFVLPTAGRYRLTFNGNATYTSGSNEFLAARFTDSSNNAVGTTSFTGGNTTGSTSNVVTLTAVVTTTGAETYKLRAATNASTIDFPAASNAGLITWTKISGFLPSSGQMVDFLSATNTASQTNIAVNTDLTNWSTISGNIPNDGTNFTLTANTTYNLKANIFFNAGTATGDAISVQWVNSSNVAINSDAKARVVTSGTTLILAVGNGVDISYTPTVNETVKLRVTAATNATCDILSGSTVSINQLGSSAVIAGVYPGTWATYTPVVTATASGTNPTLPTSAVISGSYTVQGKVMLLNFKYYAPTTTGGADGTQSYAYSIPGGYTIDTTKAAIPTVLTNTAGSGFDGGTIGSGFGRNSTGGNSAGLGFVPVSTTAFGIYFEPANRLVGASALAATGASNTVIYGTLQIPLV